MTDVVALGKMLHERIEWKNVPQDVYARDIVNLIADAIRMLYVMTGRAQLFSEDMFERDEQDMIISFSQTLPLDEQQYVLLSAQIAFLRKTQSSVDDLTSYSTDAMAVTHGDKPFTNMQQSIMDLESQRRIIWHKMIRYHLL